MYSKKININGDIFNLESAIELNSDPTTSTEANPGQISVNTTTGVSFRCRGKNGNDYIWEPTGEDLIKINEDPNSGTKISIETTDEEIEIATMDDFYSYKNTVDDNVNIAKNTADAAAQTANAAAQAANSAIQNATGAAVAAVPGLVNGWMNSHIDPSDLSVVLDTSLSISNAAADAKAAGDKISEISNAFNSSLNHDSFAPTITSGKYIDNADGKSKTSSSGKYATTGMWNGTNYRVAILLDNPTYKFKINYYNENGSTSTGNGYLGYTSYNTGVQYIPENAYYFVLTFCRQDEAALSSADITAISAALSAYRPTDRTLSKVGSSADAAAVGNFKASFDRNLTTMYEKTVSVSWFSGAINTTTGGNVNYGESDPKVRIRSDYITIANGMKITVPDGLMVRVGIYTSVGGSAGFKGWLDTGFWTGEQIFNSPVPMEATVFRILARYEPEAEIDTSAGNTVTIKRYSFKDPFIEIPQNADLNDYSTPGCYYSLNTATTTTLSNCPIPDTAFRLDVIDAKYRGYGSIRQILVKADMESDGFFMRYSLNGTTWGKWDHYTPSRAIYTPNIVYPNVKVHSQRTSANVVARYRVGTYNVAHYRMNESVNSRDYISEHPDAISNWRRWVMKSNLDFLFVTEDRVYIDEAQTKLATDYLYNPYFFKNDNVGHGHRLLTKTNFDTSSLTGVAVPNVNTRPGAYSAYYIDWCIVGGTNDPKILMAVIHNFAAGPTAVGTEEEIKINRSNFCAAIKTLLTNQAGNYDYVIIAGDTNVGNYVTKTTANREYDMALFETLCEDTNMHLVNGDEIGWFKTDPESNTDADVYDNIIVSNNIRVENIECSPFEYEVLWSDHVPLIAEISLLS